MDPLADLKDIHLPEPASWWPPAPGWIVVATLIMAAIGFFGTRWFLLYRRNRYRRAALAELDQLEMSTDSGAVLQTLNILLKRVAMRAYPGEEVAALSGEDWATFLVERGRLGDASTAADLLAEGIYRKPSSPLPDEDVAETLRLARQWIRRHA